MKPLARSLAMAIVATGVLGITVVGCGDDDQAMPPAAATATARPTATASPPASATPTEAEPMHTENLFGSTQAQGGALTVDAAEEVHVEFVACLGGSGTDCSGGIVLYNATDPGFEQAEEDEPEEPLFTLVDGTTVALEVVSLSSGVSLKFDAVILNAPGQSVVIGTTPGVHADLEWQLSLPGGGIDPGTHSVTLRMTTTSSRYTASEQFTVALVPEP